MEHTNDTYAAGANESSGAKSPFIPSLTGELRSLVRSAVEASGSGRLNWRRVEEAAGHYQQTCVWGGGDVFEARVGVYAVRLRYRHVHLLRWLELTMLDSSGRAVEEISGEKELCSAGGGASRWVEKGSFDLLKPLLDAARLASAA